MATDWAVCEVQGCRGARLDHGHCIAHACEDERSRAAEKAQTGQLLDARGVRLSSELLESLLGPSLRTPEASSGVAMLFDYATFEDDVTFEGVTFEGLTGFSRARFTGACLLAGATFLGRADFSDAVFEGDLDAAEARFVDECWFLRSTFLAPASFHGVAFDAEADFAELSARDELDFAFARFGGKADFHRCRVVGETELLSAEFRAETDFSRASFEQAVWLKHAHFYGDADFGLAEFGGDAWFDQVVFEAEADFSDAGFRADAWFYETAFMGRARLDRVTFSGSAGFVDGSFALGISFADARFAQADLVLSAPEYLSFDGASFSVPTTLKLNAPTISCFGTRFAEGGEIRVGKGDLALDAAHVGRPLIVVGTGAVPARVVSLRRADVANLVLADLDLRACRFVGAHNLDRLRMEGATRFATPPRGWQRRAAPPWFSRSSIRWTLAEEHEWRARADDGSDWYPPACRTPAWLDDISEPETLGPARIALLYRALRKAREDSKDEPGAADFYYGEMEMRRRTQASAEGTFAPTRSDRAVLWLYWLVSGYGLRAARALTALALTVLAVGFALWVFGFEPRQSIVRALLFSAESTSSLFRVPETEGFSLTYGGEVLQMALRVIGPLFVGLTLLAVRARVKR